ncbi:hypothetical protein [Thermogemmatispora carboxidivorans]|uniref:hypothetical protein n=1 Tax=Thermogemmatispora carboxidivorans TaxID=1382306 RepID=UPI0006997A81|nr:hypothetical protein [Thermogemmatispora carboxidivorans]
MRIDSLPYNNAQTQGPARRRWLQEHAPQHLEQCAALMLEALARRPLALSPGIAVLGAGACTEIPLEKLARAADEVVLVDLDRAALLQARAELPAVSLRTRVQLLTADLTGGVSLLLQERLRLLPWSTLEQEEASAFWDRLAAVLDACPVPDPPQVEDLPRATFGLAISSLVLSQLFSYPLLDLLDAVQQRAARHLGAQERHRRYQEAAQRFRLRIIAAHLHLLRDLVEPGGLVVLLSDVRGFLFQEGELSKGGPTRQALPLVPHAFFDLVRQTFTVLAERRWEWLSDLPTAERPGRGYEVVGYLAAVPAL